MWEGCFDTIFFNIFPLLYLCFSCIIIVRKDTIVPDFPIGFWQVGTKYLEWLGQNIETNMKQLLSICLVKCVIFSSGWGYLYGNQESGS